MRRSVARSGALLVALALSLAAAAPASADVGMSGPSFSGATAPTGEKPQSKLWFHDGSWWASMFNSMTTDYEIYRLDSGQWTSTGTKIDERSSSGADVLSTGDTLYVATAGNSPTTSTHGPRVLRYHYDAAARRYVLDAGFPVTVTTGGMEAVVLDRDSTGTLWITYTRDSTVYVAHSTSDDATWTAPYPLPANGAAGLTADDISTVVAYGSRIGVMWSNQTDMTMYFAYHQDGDSDQAWTTTIAARDPKIADDHMNVKALAGDPAGQVFAATKTSLTGTNDPLILLLVLGNDGQWRRYTVARVVDATTRPLVLLDKQNRRVYVFLSSPCCSGGTIYYKESSLDQIAFEPGLGTAFMTSAADTHINNPASTKQALDAASGLVAIAADDTSKRYWWNQLALGSAPPPDTTAPDTLIDSGPSGTVTSTTAEFSFSSTEPGSTFECSFDGEPWTGCTSPATRSGLAAGQHTFAVRATDSAGNTDASAATQSWTIASQVRTVFADGFESGDLSRWTTVVAQNGGSAVVESSKVSTGAFAARLAETTTAGSRAYLRETLPAPETEVRVRGSFNVEAEGAKGGNVPLVRVFDPSGVRILSLYRANQAKDRIWVAHSGANHGTTGRLSMNTWGTFTVRATSTGSTSEVVVTLNGTEIYRATGADLGTSGIAAVQVGNETAAQQFRLVADDISVTAP